MSALAEADTQAFGSIEIVNRSLEGGTLFCRDLVRFFKKRAKIEDEYNKALQKMHMKMDTTVPDRLAYNTVF
jgi:hypothetical protein